MLRARTEVARLHSPPNSSDIQIVERPATWRGEPSFVSYLLPSHELNDKSVVDLLDWSHSENLPNPRVIGPSLLEWSSLFHPRFFNAITSKRGRTERLGWCLKDDLPSSAELPRLWLESNMFLAGVTLSAAIVQARYSAGTIASKYDHAWEAGMLSESGVGGELRVLDLKGAVLEFAADTSLPDLDRLIELRDLYMASWKLLAPAYGDVETMSAHPDAGASPRRFGFLDDLRERCGKALDAIIVYGSSVLSDSFADYDLLLVAESPKSTLRRLAGTSPSWRGKEINLGVYSPEELVSMQRLSGDNLSDYAVCLWGAAPVIRKSTSRLLVRNFSFGIIRQRQQIGMLSRVVSHPPQAGDAYRNLYDYFVKIPANIVKGTLGALGEQWPKEHVHRWMLSETGFDVVGEQMRAVNGNTALALARSVIATGSMLDVLNRRARLAGPAC